ncbi:hypothetical protein MMPV_006118 [Pyropia vietnamensis]
MASAKAKEALFAEVKAEESAVSTVSVDRMAAPQMGADILQSSNLTRRALPLASASLVALLVGLFGSGIYVYCGRWAYLAIAVVLTAPSVLAPFVAPPAVDAGRPLGERYGVKATLWLAIFGFVGNWFWSHYFYTLLGATYTFDAHALNGAPVVAYLLTHVYFLVYHIAAAGVLRRLAAAGVAGPVYFAAVGGLAYTAAVFEAVSIAHFPGYSFPDVAAAVGPGAVVYALYFVVSFPAYTRLDAGRKGWSMRRVAADALAATMAVTLLLDFWRVGIGRVYGGDPVVGGMRIEGAGSEGGGGGGDARVPWI